MPKISVCIPTYNRSRYLAECMKSILDQAGDYELIISDNASTDETPDVVKSFSDPRIRYFRNTTNLGFVGNLNKSLEHATSKYVQFIQDDDMISVCALDRLSSILDAYPNVGFVFSSCYLMDEEGQTYGIYLPYRDDFIRTGIEHFRQEIFGNSVWFSGVMVRRECYKNLGIYNENLPVYADWEMWLRISLFYDVAYIAEPLAYRRMHRHSMSSYLASADGETLTKHLQDYIGSESLQSDASPTWSHLDEYNRMLNTLFTEYCKTPSLRNLLLKYRAFTTSVYIEVSKELGDKRRLRRRIVDCLRRYPIVLLDWRFMLLMTLSMTSLKPLQKARALRTRLCWTTDERILDSSEGSG